MAELFLLIIRWLHTIAAVTWVGGGIFYWVVVRPALRTGDSSGLVARLVGPEFGGLVRLCMWTLVLTGAVLALDTLSAETGTVTYFVVLSAKAALAAWMFFIVRAWRRLAPQEGRQHSSLRKAANALGHVNMAVVLGIVVFVLSDVLRWLVQRELGG